MLNTIVSKLSEIEKSCLRCGPAFSQEYLSLMTLPLEEFETILRTWFNVYTANASIDGPQLKEKAVRVAVHLGIGSFRTSHGWIVRFEKIHNLVYKTFLGDSTIVNPETVIGLEKRRTAQNNRWLPAEEHI
jgi:hypothetical protein